MIVVIADDISGAAELAGVARGFGLSAEVHTRFDAAPTAAVVAIDTNTRSLPSERAAEIARETAELVRVIQPDWVYKKTDSVLRGNVEAEVEAVRAALGKSKCVFIPANPGKRRVIRGGHYFIDEVPLHETPFREDPEFPAVTSCVTDLLGRPSQSRGAAKNWVIPDVADGDDLEGMARSMDKQTLPAGAAEFFAAILKHRGFTTAAGVKMASRHGVGKSLFICGSRAGWETGRKRQCAEHGIPVLEMPAALLDADRAGPAMIDVANQWGTAIAGAWEGHDAVMMAIGGGETSVTPSALLERLVTATKQLLNRVLPARLHLEGGATAAAVLRSMNWRRLRVVEPLAFGIASLEVVGCRAPTLFIKPGSYPWPDEVWSKKGE